MSARCAQVLDENRGGDITQLFDGASGHSHSRAAKLLLERYYRGDVKGAAQGAELDEEQRILQLQAKAQENVVDESKGLLSQVRCAPGSRGEEGGWRGGGRLPGALSWPLFAALCSARWVGLAGAQVMQLNPQVYMDWVAVPSTGHPHMFDSAFMERLTSAPWWVRAAGGHGTQQLLLALVFYIAV